MLNNIWRRLSTSQKLSVFGSLMLAVSVFLNWYSDKDVFRSGVSYSAISGPLYLLGFSILLLAVFNLSIVVMEASKVKMATSLQVGTRGKLQMMAGFGSMYLLLLINSVYFHPQFGLNILDKKSEIGTMVALSATVLICVAGYLSYRRKFIQPGDMSAREVVKNQQPVPETVVETVVATVQSPAPSETAPTPVTTPAPTPVTTPAPVMSANTAHLPAHEDYFSDRDPRGKTEYERAKLYENLKRTMVRDTLTPEQRRKMLAREAKENAFSANFGKSGHVVSPGGMGGERTARSLEDSVKAAPSQKKEGEREDISQKKPQMYRMDL